MRIIAKPNGHLHFIRLKMGFRCPDYYDDVTDVWMFGDVRGYQWFQAQLKRATTLTKNIHIPPAPKSWSMRVVIVPAAKRPVRMTRVRMWERIVRWRGRVQMELVIYGNVRGYNWLSERIDCELGSGRDNPQSHTHVDLDDVQLTQRSVALNIRGPLSRWSRNELAPYELLVCERQGSFLPEDARFESDSPYEEIDPSSFGSLRL